MRYFEKGPDAIDTSEDIVKEMMHRTKEDFFPEQELKTTIDMLMDDDFIREYSNAYAGLNHMKGVRILDAHGFISEKGKWMYSDDKKVHKVQDWIDHHDGYYAVLGLCCCNPSAEEIYSRRSLVIAPNQSISPIDLRTGAFQLELYVPEKGYIDSYCKDFELAEIRSCLDQMEM